jgi:hypothetical protein
VVAGCEHAPAGGHEPGDRLSFIRVQDWRAVSDGVEVVAAVMADQPHDIEVEQVDAGLELEVLDIGCCVTGQVRLGHLHAGARERADQRGEREIGRAGSGGLGETIVVINNDQNSGRHSTPLDLQPRQPASRRPA